MEFLVESLVFLCAALVAVPICKRLGLSSVLGYLAAGLVIGPHGYGLLGEADDVLHFAEIGVVLLLFIIGLEVQPKRLWIMRRYVFGLGTLQIGVTTVVLAAITQAVFAPGWPAAILIGFSLALSSTAFVLQLLGERKELNSPHGRAGFGVLLMQDIAVIPGLAILTLLAPGADGGSGLNPWAVGAVIVGVVAARYSLRPALRWIAATGVHELFVAAGLALVAGAAVAMQAAGLSMGLGAFIAGMLVADSEFRHQLETDVMPFKGLLLGLFFIAVGMSADLSLLADSPGLIIGLAAALVAVKAAVLFPLARAFSINGKESLKTAVVLSQGGEFAFVLLTAATDYAMLLPEHAAVAILIVTISMATTPLLVALVERTTRQATEDRPFDQIDEPPQPVIIAGFGRFAQIVARVLNMKGIPFIALEANPSEVDFVRRFGNEIYFGDATRLDLLQMAHVSEASAVVIAVDDYDAALKITELVRETAPKTKIFARARNRLHEIRLRELGAHFVIRETLLSSLELTENLLLHLTSDTETVHRAIEMFKEHDEKTLQRQAAVRGDADAYRQTTRDAAQELREIFAADAESRRRSEEPAT
ncbi:MAG: monovalent cation:proton antiporter-2 (CPA2) family protein [Gammaproteobacteria bacterium]|nr:monovalent cation:proton antiporter-2 (CPA2) family protein [Gammaproteobacteria bacterium]